MPGADGARRRQARRILLAMLGIALAPVVAAVLAWLFWNPQRINYGDLLTPAPLPDVPLATLDGRPIRLSDLRGRWLLVQVSGARCDEPCVKRHFAMRQVRLMQNRNMERIERVWLITDQGTPDRKLLEAYAGLHVIRAPGEARAWFPADDPANHIFVVDPLGNVMLRFPRDPDPKGMHRDLGRLLRASRVG